MATIFDVAQYILEKHGAMSAMKLQKLAYYSQAWHMVWEDTVLFKERIEAWANGPVSPALYDAHRGDFLVERLGKGRSDQLRDHERESIDAVLKVYGDKNAQWLSDLTHGEDPWKDARNGLADGERSDREITQAAMHEYYSSL